MLVDCFKGFSSPGSAAAVARSRGEKLSQVERVQVREDF